MSNAMNTYKSTKDIESVSFGLRLTANRKIYFVNIVMRNSSNEVRQSISVLTCLVYDASEFNKGEHSCRMKGEITFIDYSQLLFLCHESELNSNRRISLTCKSKWFSHVDQALLPQSSLLRFNYVEWSIRKCERSCKYSTLPCGTLADTTGTYQNRMNWSTWEFRRPN